MAQYGPYGVAPDGSVGPLVALSPKTGFCIAEGRGTVTAPKISTSDPNTLLVAFVAADSAAVEVSGAGLSWSLAGRSSAGLGTTAIWSARALQKLVDTEVTATPSLPGAKQSLTVIAFRGAAGIGAAGCGAASHGRPTAFLTSTRAGSAVLGVGHDRTPAILQASAAGQMIIHQWRPSAELERSRCQACARHLGPRLPVRHSTQAHLFCVQGLQQPTSSAGQVVRLASDHPVDAQWSLTAVEIQPLSIAGPESPVGGALP